MGFLDEIISMRVKPSEKENIKLKAAILKESPLRAGCKAINIYSSENDLMELLTKIVASGISIARSYNVICIIFNFRRF